MRVSLKSVSGVDSVGVSLDKGLASVKMKAHSTATLKQLQEAIAKNGFTMKQSTASIAGKVVTVNGRTMLQVLDSNEMLELAPDSSAKSASISFNGKNVLVDGTIPEAGKGKSPNSIRYQSIKEESK